MSARCLVGAVAAATAAVVLSTTPVAPQDIEAVARARGIELPRAYYDGLARNPDLYEFERALFRRAPRAVGPLAGPVRSSGPAATATTGRVQLPVVLALFADSPQEPHISRDMVQASLFSGPAARGTITEAYLEMSRGALEVGGQALGWVRSSLTMSEVVGADRGFGADARIGEYLVEALDAIDATVDFSDYDNDGPDGVANSGDDDGFVDVITFEYLEVAASCGGPAIWPHRSRMSFRTGAAYATDDLGVNGDTIRIQDYITQSAADCSGENVQDAAVITHEFGHALGLPDWYHWIDTSIGPFGRRWVLGCWALMAAGSWGCGPVGTTREPFGPTHMIGYSKNRMGWVDYLDIGEVWNEEVVLEPMETTGLPLRIQLDDAGAEYLIAEFRRTVGFDSQLPGDGVLLYKQDDNASLRPNPSSSDPYFLTMLERDGNSSLLKISSEGGSRGEIGDAWGVDGVSGKLNAATTPGLRLAGGGHTSVMVHEVYVEGDQARLVLSTGRTPRLVQPAEAAEVMRIRSFRAPVRIAGGRGPYTGVGDLPAGFGFEAVGDELFLVGSVREPGPFTYSVAVRDVSGAVSEPVLVEVAAPIPWAVELPALVGDFVTPSAPTLTPGERAYLDDAGNANGVYDIGDLRKWMRAGGG